MANTIPTVEKTIAVIRLIGNSESGMTQAELCRALEITPSTCYRILQSLTAEDWLRKSSGKKYDLSDGLLTVCQRLNEADSRFEVLQPKLEALAKETGFMVKLSVRRGGDQLTLLRAESPQPIAVSSRIGARYPIIEGSVGAALLSRTDEARIRELIAFCRISLPEKEIPGLVADRIREVRETGFCFNQGIGRWKVGALSVPIMDRAGFVKAALTLLGHNDDFIETDRFRLAQAMKRTAIECAKLI